MSSSGTTAQKLMSKESYISKTHCVTDAMDGGQKSET